MGSKWFRLNLCLIDFAGTPATISLSGILLITEDPFLIITLVPIFNLCLIVQLSPPQKASPFLCTPYYGARRQCTISPNFYIICNMHQRIQFCTVTNYGIWSEPLAMEKLEDTSTLSPILTPHIWGNLSSSKLPLFLIQKTVCSDYHPRLYSAIISNCSVLFNRNTNYHVVTNTAIISYFRKMSYLALPT